jgi:hypothetical protein
VSEFTAPAEGELYLYVNDAMLAIPFGGPTVECFYANNSGKAKITVERFKTPTTPTAQAPPPTR